jgi:hypothetical protein
MDRPSADVLLKVARTSSWHKAKANIMTLAATLPEGSEQRKDFEDACVQFIDHIEGNKLNA